MTIASRITRLFTADLHAVLDQIEEPEALLNQAIREMDDELEQMRTLAKGIRNDGLRLERQSKASAKRLIEIESELELCFASNEEELARALIRRKLENEKQSASLETSRDNLTNRLSDIETNIAENERALSSLREKSEILGADAPNADDTMSVYEFKVDEADVDIAYLREKQRRNTQ